MAKNTPIEEAPTPYTPTNEDIVNALVTFAELVSASDNVFKTHMLQKVDEMKRYL